MSKTNNTISVYEFMGVFPNELSAVKYFEKIRWNDKPVCPFCKAKNKSTKKSGKRIGLYRWKGKKTRTQEVEAAWRFCRQECYTRYA